MVDAFFLKFQRDNRKNASVVLPPRGKPEKKAVFSPHCEDKTTTNYNKAFTKQQPPAGGWFTVSAALRPQQARNNNNLLL